MLRKDCMRATWPAGHYERVDRVTLLVRKYVELIEVTRRVLDVEDVPSIADGEDELFDQSDWTFD